MRTRAAAAAAALLPLLMFAGAAAKDAVLVAVQTERDGQAVLVPPAGMEHSVAELVAPQEKVVVVGTFALANHMEVVPNTFFTDDAADGRFPLESAGSLQPGVWLAHTGRTTADGASVLLLHCSKCAGKVSAAVQFFTFIAKAAHHTVLLSHLDSPQHADVLKTLRHHLSWAAATAAPPDAIEEHATAPPAFQFPPMTWASYGRIKTMKSGLEAVGLSEVLVKRLEPVVSGKGSPAPSAEGVDELFAAAVASARPHDVTGGLLAELLRASLEEAAGNPLRLEMDMQALIRRCVATRQSYALEFFGNVVRGVARGDPEWFRVLSTAAPREQLFLSAPAGAAAAAAAPPSKQNLLLAGAAELAVRGAGGEVLQSAPASLKEFRTGIDAAWRGAVVYFEKGLGGVPDAERGSLAETRDTLHQRLGQVKAEARDSHVEHVGKYVTELLRVVKEAAGRAYEAEGLDSVCDPAVEDSIRKELLAGADQIFKQPLEWWPTFQGVKDAKVSLVQQIEETYHQRMAAAADFVKEAVETAAEAQVVAAKAGCTLVADALDRPAAVAARCANATRDAVARLEEAAAHAAPAGRCGGSWVKAHPAFAAARAALRKAVDEHARAVEAQNEERAAAACAGESEAFVEATKEAFAAVEADEVPDEKLLLEIGARREAEAASAVTAKFSDFKSSVKCAAALQEAVRGEAVEARLRVEHRLFGSPEVRQWQQAWAAAVKEEIPQCFLCQINSYFVQSYLKSTAEKSLPEAIGGKPISPGFRAGIVSRVVAKELPSYPAPYEAVTYACIVIAIGTAVLVAKL